VTVTATLTPEPNPAIVIVFEVSVVLSGALVTSVNVKASGVVRPHPTVHYEASSAHAQSSASRMTMPEAVWVGVPEVSLPVM
jgi:hypothetical protein